ncbi:MAG TPA: tRNA preQ1(34) S-adenosylmethionine ribosyltransferase-isomerase QueA [Thermoanaerobaculia bacterium]|nr:tRNA preQ1(34) S-adenosylmethionine ribosyltransferase-isomerase QueA [Thermoanaerobaculia bacterium]
MKRSDFHYDLPKELIAQAPLRRGESRMMIVRPGEGATEIEHSLFSQFPLLLSPDDLLVLNDTRVFPARLIAAPLGNMKRPVEVLLTERVAPMRWEAWCRPARRVRLGARLDFSAELAAMVMEKRDGVVLLQFSMASEADDPEAAFWTELERIGLPPLPPYIRRDEPQDEDRERYQTIYAAKRGAIAAPTAGLHFTPELLDSIRARGVTVVEITLHVGLGTFEPVKVEDLARHRMHSEHYEIGEGAANAINGALREGRRIVAVGTTVVRALESAVRVGGGGVRAGAGETGIFITPGFEFRVVGALLTNFHLPESTLLMLVSAFGGMETIRSAYREAVGRGYRFFSYGDCMFLARMADRRQWEPERSDSR